MSTVHMVVSVFKTNGDPHHLCSHPTILTCVSRLHQRHPFFRQLIKFKILVGLETGNYIWFTPMLLVGLYFSIIGVVIVGSLVSVNEIPSVFSPQLSDVYY